MALQVANRSVRVALGIGAQLGPARKYTRACSRPVSNRLWMRGAVLEEQAVAGEQHGVVALADGG